MSLATSTSKLHLGCSRKVIPACLAPATGDSSIQLRQPLIPRRVFAKRSGLANLEILD